MLGLQLQARSLLDLEKAYPLLPFLQQYGPKIILDLEMSLFETIWYFFESIQYCQKCVSFATEWAKKGPRPGNELL